MADAGPLARECKVVIEDLFPRGKVVWAKMRGHSWWPGTVIDGSDVGYTIKKGNSYRLICWLGEHNISEISITLLRNFIDDYDLRKDKRKIKSYKVALAEALQELACRLNQNLSHRPEEQIEWAKNSFKPRDASKHSTVMTKDLLTMISCVKQDLIQIQNQRKRKSTASNPGPSNKVFVCQDPLSNEDVQSDSQDAKDESLASSDSESDSESEPESEPPESEPPGKGKQSTSQDAKGEQSTSQDAKGEQSTSQDAKGEQLASEDAKGEQIASHDEQGASLDAKSQIARIRSCSVDVEPFFPEGKVVWAKRNMIWWPSVIINTDDQDQEHFDDDGLKIVSIYSFGNHEISQISVGLSRDFIRDFNLHDMNEQKSQYKQALLEAIKEFSLRFGTENVYDTFDEKIQWASSSFLPRQNPENIDKMTPDLLLKIAEVKANQVSMANVPEESTSHSGSLQNECVYNSSFDENKVSGLEIPDEEIDAVSQVTIEVTQPCTAQLDDSPSDDTQNITHQKHDSVIIDHDYEKKQDEYNEIFNNELQLSDEEIDGLSVTIDATEPSTAQLDNIIHQAQHDSIIIDHDYEKEKGEFDEFFNAVENELHLPIEEIDGLVVTIDATEPSTAQLDNIIHQAQHDSIIIDHDYEKEKGGDSNGILNAVDENEPQLPDEEIDGLSVTIDATEPSTAQLGNIIHQNQHDGIIIDHDYETEKDVYENVFEKFEENELQLSDEIDSLSITIAATEPSTAQLDSIIHQKHDSIIIDHDYEKEKDYLDKFFNVNENELPDEEIDGLVVTTDAAEPYIPQLDDFTSDDSGNLTHQKQPNRIIMGHYYEKGKGDLSSSFDEVKESDFQLPFEEIDAVGLAVTINAEDSSTGLFDDWTQMNPGMLLIQNNMMALS